MGRSRAGTAEAERGRAGSSPAQPRETRTTSFAPIVLNRFLRPTIFGTEGDEGAAAAAEEAIERPLDYLESELRGDGWLDGEFTIGDIAFASAIKTLSYTGWGPDRTRHPNIAGWYGRVSERPDSSRPWNTE